LPLFRASADAVRARAESGTLSEVLTEQFVHAMGYRPSPAEIRSWERSLAVLGRDLVDAGLGDVEVLLEHKLPLTSKRVDAILCGSHPRTGDDSYVVVELKQWSDAQAIEDTDDQVIVENHRVLLHPVLQVRGYCDYLADYVASLSDHPERLAGVAYLHNATDQSVEDLWALSTDERGRMFTGQRRGAFLDYLKNRLTAEPGAAAADALLDAAIRPSKQLLALAAEEIQQREQFVLLDEQRVAYELVMRAVSRARGQATKEVVIVKGGPGSGKSVIALSLLGELSRQGRSALHATGSSAFTMTLRKVAGRRSPRVRSMFKYYNQFIDAEANGLDVLILDEAHRIKETSTNRYTPARMRTGRPQVEELISAARVPVFLLDEHQVVRPSERGTVADIKAAAARLGCETVEVDLDGQFRLGGSRAYEQWVLRLLGLVPGGPIGWEGDDDFELGTVSTPNAMDHRLDVFHETGYTVRIAAGYCWPWSSPNPDGSLPDDIVIGDWRRPWNNPKDTSSGGAPGRPFWATDPAGFGQVGCVYTAQGFEYDYGGVIFGPDLVWRSGQWVSRQEFSHDNALKRSDPAEFDRAIRNTYKVLLTRALRGVEIYSTDRETQAFLESLISARVESAAR
jgi:hypothetical protein